MFSKEKLKEHIDNFPDDKITIEALAERLLMLKKLEKRVANSNFAGSTISEDKLKQEIERWSK
jgi:hypothetical protein